VPRPRFAKCQACPAVVPARLVKTNVCISPQRIVMTRHMSFRLTPPPYMSGKRVKKRLRILAYISAVCMVTTCVLVLAALVEFVMTPAGAFLRNSAWLCILLGLGLPHITVRLICILLRLLYRKYGLMTREEAQDFPFCGRWPDSWLEPKSVAADSHSHLDEAEQGCANPTKEKGASLIQLLKTDSLSRPTTCSGPCKTGSRASAGVRVNLPSASDWMMPLIGTG
jgi:hypothetical protein